MVGHVDGVVAFFHHQMASSRRVPDHNHRLTLVQENLVRRPVIWKESIPFDAIRTQESGAKDLRVMIGFGRNDSCKMKTTKGQCY